jgi:hypothetical protein
MYFLVESFIGVFVLEFLMLHRARVANFLNIG